MHLTRDGRLLLDDKDALPYQVALIRNGCMAARPNGS